MNLNLRAHPGSISAAALKFDDPLRVLRVLNHVPSWSKCSIRVRKPGERNTQLDFCFRGLTGQALDILPCLDGIVPEVFDCEMLEFCDSKNVHRLQGPRIALDKSHDSLQLGLTSDRRDKPSEETCLTLMNFRQPSILPQLTSADTVIARLHADTLMKCGNAMLGDRSVTIALLTNESKTIRRRGFNRERLQNLQTEQTPIFTRAHRFEANGVMVDLLLWAGTGAAQQSRLQVYAGAAPVTLPNSTSDQTFIRPLNTKLDSQTKPYFGFALEVAAPGGLLSYDLDHSLVPDTRYRDLVKCVRSWLHKIVDSREMHNLYGSVRELREEDVANRIQERQVHLRRNSMVFLHGQPLLQEPRSEKDVLALYFKLEGAGVLPVASCCVLEHTPARGTDAIGHFRISPADASNQYALIEFEHQFSNFHAHGHSARHVDLIICWNVSEKDSLGSTKHPWLMSYTASDIEKTIPVIILGRIPGLEVKNG